MSSTSSGLLCKMAAASLNVTPSKLVLFSEMSLPPGKKRDKIFVIGLCGCFNHNEPASVFSSQLKVRLLTGFDTSISVRRPIRHNGGNEDPKVKFTCIVLSHDHKA